MNPVGVGHARLYGPVPEGRDMRANPADVRTVILALCSERYLSLRELAELLGRRPASVQNHYLTPMVREGVLQQRYPGNPNHPNQGYRKT